MIRICCPRCNTSYGLDLAFMGKEVYCKPCNDTFIATPADDTGADFLPPSVSKPSASRPPVRPEGDTKSSSSSASKPTLKRPVTPPKLPGSQDEPTPLEDPKKSSKPVGSGRNARPPVPPMPPVPNQKSAKKTDDKDLRGGSLNNSKGKKKTIALIAGLAATFVFVISGLFIYFVFGPKKVAPIVVETPVTNPDRDSTAKSDSINPLEIPVLLTPSTVLIQIGDRLGTGVLIHRNPHVIVTNHHVVGDSGTPTIYFPVRDDKRQVIRKISHYSTRKDLLGLRGTVKFREPYRDLAFVEVENVPDDARAIPMALESARESETVYGVGQSGVDFNSLWISNTGTVRAITQLPLRDGAGGTFQALLSQQPINASDSGGPVVNSRMELVGVVSAKARKSLDTKNLNVQGLDNFSIIIDVSELRTLTEEVFRLAYKLPFDHAPTISGEGSKSGGGNIAEKEKVPTEDLVKDLEKGTPEKATAAAYALKKRGPEAVPMLVKSLEDKSCQGRWPMILQTLELIGESAAQAVEPAISCLRQQHLPTKIAAARFLGAIAPHGKSAIEDLWVALSSTDSLLRREAKNAILRYGPYGKSHVAELQRRASTDNPFVKASVVSIMCDITDMDQKEFRQAMTEMGIFDSNDSRLRALIAAVIKDSPGRFTRQDQFRAFLSMLGDTETNIQETALDGLDKMTWEQSVPMAIIDKTGKPIKNAKGNPIVVTGYRPWQSGDSGKVQLPDGSDSTKMYSDSDGKPLYFCKIRRISQEDVEFLFQIVNDKTPDPAILYALELIHAATVKTIDHSHLKMFLKDDRRPRIIAAALQIALSINTAIDSLLDELLALTKHSDQRIRGLSTACLGLLHKDYPPVLEAMFAALEDTDGELREFGEKALIASMALRENRFQSSAELKLAERTLRTSQQPQARRLAARVLANAGEGSKTAFEALYNALDDKDYHVRVSAVIAIGKLGKTSEPAVRKLAEFVTHRMDEDNAMFTTDESSLRSFNKADAVAMSERLRQAREEIEKKLDIANDKEKILVQNNYLRRLSLESLSRLGVTSRDALPEIQKIIKKKVNHELLMIALLAVRQIAKDSPGDNGLLVEDCLALFKYEADSNTSVEGAIDSLLEANGRKRAPVTNAVMETIQAIGAKSQAGVRTVINESIKRVVTGSEVLPATGGVESMILLFEKTDVVPDGSLQLALANYSSYLTKEKAKFQKVQRNKEAIERIENRIARVNLLKRLMDEAGKKTTRPK